MSENTVQNAPYFLSGTELETIARQTRIVVASIHSFPRVIVDYSLLLEEMIAAGEFDSVISCVTSENFPILRSDQEMISVEILHFNREISGDDVCTNFKRMGFRPLNLVELLAFWAKYRSEYPASETPCIALGSAYIYPPSHNHWLRPDFPVIHELFVEWSLGVQGEKYFFKYFHFAVTRIATTSKTFDRSGWLRRRLGL